MNDNSNPKRRPRRPRLLLIQGGKAPAPGQCFCGDHPLVEIERHYTGRVLRFVACPSCGAEGPREAAFDLAVTAWNSLTEIEPPRL